MEDAHGRCSWMMLVEDAHATMHMSDAHGRRSCDDTQGRCSWMMLREDVRVMMLTGDAHG